MPATKLYAPYRSIVIDGCPVRTYFTAHQGPRHNSAPAASATVVDFQLMEVERKTFESPNNTASKTAGKGTNVGRAKVIRASTNPVTVAFRSAGILRAPAPAGRPRSSANKSQTIH